MGAEQIGSPPSTVRDHRRTHHALAIVDELEIEVRPDKGLARHSLEAVRELRRHSPQELAAPREVEED
jgi:hypothetical protein